MHTNRKGFTLIEILVVIAIIAILAGVLVVGYRSILAKFYAHEAEQEMRNFERLLEGYFLNEDSYVYRTSLETSPGKYPDIDVTIEYDLFEEELYFSYAISDGESMNHVQKKKVTRLALSRLYEELLEGSAIEVNDNIFVELERGSIRLEVDDDSDELMNLYYRSNNDVLLLWSIDMEMG